MADMLKSIRNRIERPITEGLGLGIEHYVNNESVAQKNLIQQYRTMAHNYPESLPDIREAGFSKYSQYDEDGILLYLFSLIKPANRVCVEICAGNGKECNSSNLIVNHGWWGHLFDGDENNVRTGRSFFKKNRDAKRYPPHLTKAWVTAENVNELIAEPGASGPIDLLSIDLDGMVYWVRKAISVIQPQFVVCETHNAIPLNMSFTVSYDPEFAFQSKHYRGASLAAVNKPGQEKRYRLIGTHKFGFNALFVHNGLGESFFPKVEVESYAQDPRSQLARNKGWAIGKTMSGKRFDYSATHSDSDCHPQRSEGSQSRRPFEAR